MARATKTDLPKFEDRVRFNWGFHDGSADAQAKRRPLWYGKPHHDAVYVEGYESGAAFFSQQGYRPESSEPSWVARQANKKAAAATRKALRDARPSASTVRI